MQSEIKLGERILDTNTGKSNRGYANRVDDGDAPSLPLCQRFKRAGDKSAKARIRSVGIQSAESKDVHYNARTSMN